LHEIQLIWHLVKRDFSVQYKGSFLGVLWSLLLPLTQLLILIYVFQRVIPLDIEDYPVFVFCALLPWTWFSNCLNSAPNVFKWNRDLVLKPKFEPLKLIVVNILTNFLLFLIALPVLFFICFLYDRPISVNLIFLPLLILIQALLIFGLAIVVAVLNIFFSDVQYLVYVLVSMLFFLTPVFYGYTEVGTGVTSLLSLNPLAALIHNYRSIFYYGVNPEWKQVLYALTISTIICIIGYILYNKMVNAIYDKI
jgi:lipopolysaccharide transport system permease protein